MRITIEGADVGCRCGVVEEDDEGREERMDGEAEGETWLSTKLMREHKGAYIIHSLQSFTPLPRRPYQEVDRVNPTLLV